MTDPQSIGTLLEQAWTYAGLGFEIFPVAPTKRPLHSQLEATTDLDQIEAWWRRWPAALIGHRISPHHLLLDIDPRHGGKAVWKALRAEMPAIRTRTHLSGRGDGGGHVWFQRPADKLTATKLDTWAKARGLGGQIKGRWSSGIDLLRHEHRYTILPPSKHPDTGEPYYWAKGRGLALEPAPMPALLAELVTADEIPEPAEPSGPQFVDPDSIADWYSSTHGFGPLLSAEGWTLVAGDGESDGSRWRHPEATTAVSATVRHGCLFVYSTSTAFEPTGPGEVHGYTPFRAFAALHHNGDLKAAGRAARKERQGKPDGVNQKMTPEGSTEGRRLVMTPASEIALRRVRWCWEGRLAVGTLGLLAGPEGLGKSTVAATIGAALTRGTLPGEFEGAPAAVLVCATEDSWAHTIAPRFLAAGADLGRVYKIEAAEAGLTTPLSLPTDLVELEAVAGNLGAALLIFDPLISRLDAALDSHRDGEVRQALEPLVKIADRTGMAILGLIHHNKSGKSDPLDLVMASKAFTAVARSVHTVVRDPDEEGAGRRFFGTPKNNLGTIDLPTLSFGIEPFIFDTDDGPGSTGKVVWQGEHRESIADVLVRANEDPGKRTAEREAIAWLREFMAEHDGRVPAVVGEAAAAEAGHSRTTLQRARSRLHVGSVREGRGWLWIVKIPADPQDSGDGILESSPPRFQDSNKPSPHAHASAHAREAEDVRVDPDSPEFDPELYGPDGEPWCRPDGKGGCLNTGRCRNPSHRGPVTEDDL